MTEAIQWQAKELTKPPWDVAREDNVIVIARIMGPMYGVYYPYRKGGDLYVALDGKPVFCCQCEQTFPLEDFPAHIESHDRRLKKKVRV